MSPHASDRQKKKEGRKCVSIVPVCYCSKLKQLNKNKLNNDHKPVTAETLTGWVHGFPVVSGADLLHQSFVVVPIKGHGAMHQGVEEHAQRPGVHLRAPVGTAVDDLRGGVEWAAAEGLEILVPVVQV